MTPNKSLTALMVTLGLQFAVVGPALAGPALQQAQQLIDAHDYFRATRVLTDLVAQPGNADAERAQELLGNVREAAGQLAQAKAEYLIYLKKYPNGEGAGRVRARLSAMLGGAPAGGAAAGGAGATVGAGGATVTDRGVASLTYRFNQSASTVTDLVPTTGERDDTDTSLAAGLKFTRTIATDERTVKLSFNGVALADFGTGANRPMRISEAFVSVDNKHSGLVLTFGRQRVTPQGLGDRVDGLTLSWPTSNGIVLGTVLGTAVDSTSDGLFGNKQMVLGASATFSDVLAPGGVLSVYYVGQGVSSQLYRSAIGAEYTLNTKAGSVAANLDYDLKFAAVNRAAIYGTWIIDDVSRVTGRLSYYHGPGLNLANALIGQDSAVVTSLDLIPGGPYTDAQLFGFAADRTAATTMAGLTYFRQLNPTWNLTVDGTLWETGSMPASAGVGAVAGLGLGTSAGVDFLGSSVFNPGDSVDFGLHYSAVGGGSLVSGEASMRFPVSDAFSLQPRVTIGRHQYGGTGGSETFILPSLNGNYRIDRATNLQFQIGGQWSRGSGSTTTTGSSAHGLFFSAGISRSF